MPEIIEIEDGQDLPPELRELLEEVFSDPEFQAEVRKKAQKAAENDIAWVKGYIEYGKRRDEAWQEWAMFCVETGQAMFH